MNDVEARPGSLHDARWWSGDGKIHLYERERNGAPRFYVPVHNDRSLNLDYHAPREVSQPITDLAGKPICFGCARAAQRRNQPPAGARP